MDVIGQLLERRDGTGDQNERRAAELDRKKAGEAWMCTGHREEVRLLAFDRWVRAELSARLEWGWAGAHRTKRIEQCRLHLETMVLELWRRGWYLDGRRLADRITELLDAVGKYQRTGKVTDFWSYFQACVRRYVGANAEEIQIEARRASAILGPWIAAFGNGKRSILSLPELVAQRADEITKAKAATLREKLARERARSVADDAQGELL